MANQNGRRIRYQQMGGKQMLNHFGRNDHVEGGFLSEQLSRIILNTEPIKGDVGVGGSGNINAGLVNVYTHYVIARPLELPAQETISTADIQNAFWPEWGYHGYNFRI